MAKKNIKLAALGAAVAIAGVIPAYFALNNQDSDKPSANAQYSAPLEQKLTPANEFLRTLPNSLESVSSIQKYEASGAKYCLIHIPQAHCGEHGTMPCTIKDSDLADFTANLNRDFYRRVNTHQKNVCGILEYLIENHGITEIMSEGVWEPLDKDGVREHWAKALKIASVYSFRTPEESKKAISENPSNFVFVPGADLYLGLKGKLKILPADKQEVHAEASKIALKHKPSEKIFQDKVVHARNKALIELVAQSDSPVQLVLYGKKHDMSLEIGDHNEANPNSKISYVVINPETLSLFKD